MKCTCQPNGYLDRKEEILNLLTERELITSQLKSSIESAQTMTELEDIYRPYKEKKNTRASIAIKKRLGTACEYLAVRQIEQAGI